MSFDPIRPKWTEVSQNYWFDLFNRFPRDQLAVSLELPAIGTILSDHAAMFLAFTRALVGVGDVAPNPLVGAVVCDQWGGYLASGGHQRVGGAHAEVNALAAVTDKNSLDGARVYVTLEPCAHEGRTPSCARMLAKTGIASVTYGVTDPNPAVNGSGVKILEAAGKKVRMLAGWQTHCEWLARVFIHNQKTKSVYTAMKVASSPSGVIAGDKTSRLWITGERARQMGHYLRLEYDAICVGARTVLLDDPTLDVRHPVLTGRMPIRIIVDGEGILEAQSASFKALSQQPDKTIVFLPINSQDTLEKRFGVRVVHLPADGRGRFLWSDVKRKLWELGITSLLLEGGAGVYRSALEQGAVDALHWFVAPNGPVDGLKWSVNSEVSEIYKSAGGVPLGEDRLIEVSLSAGGKDFV